MISAEYRVSELIDKSYSFVNTMIFMDVFFNNSYFNKSWLPL
jgi:hypothetical protein